MSSSSDISSCLQSERCCSIICLGHCCPDWMRKKSQNKQPQVKYTPVKVIQDLRRSPLSTSGHEYSHDHSPWRAVSMLAAITVPPEVMLSFPQERTGTVMHPRMISQGIGPFFDKASHDFMRRFNSTSTSSLEFSQSGRKISNTEYIKDEGNSLKPTTEPARTFRRSIGLPYAILSSLQVPGKQKREKLQRELSPPLMDEEEWIPELPVLQESVLEETADHPVLQFCLYHDILHCTLTVHLHRAYNLPLGDRRHTIVILYLIPNKEEIFQSKSISTPNPVFNQSFEFNKVPTDDLRRQTLILRVYHNNKFSLKDGSLGGVALPLSGADLYGVVMRMKIEEILREVNKGTKGDILMALYFDPQMGLLKGVVSKVTNLKKQDILGAADPYVKVNLIYQQNKIAKWKSTVKRNTLTPVFNESFRFNVMDKDIGEVQLEVVVMDYDRFTRNDAMGVVHLGRDVNQESGRQHWMDMLQSPQHSISMWHTILSVTQNVTKSPRHNSII